MQPQHQNFLGKKENNLGDNIAKMHVKQTNCHFYVEIVKFWLILTHLKQFFFWGGEEMTEGMKNTYLLWSK